jgi:hypothetical protein
MEVHHHPHAEKKKFKEYFLEFLMILLAVIMGFFAERLLENTISREKERHYIKGILTDLGKDTANLHTSFAMQNWLIENMDSVLKLPIEKLRDISVQNILYRHFVTFYANFWVFIPNNTTVTQLKNAGGFSVFSNQKAMDSITATYYYYDTWVKINADEYMKSFERTGELATQLIRLPVPPPSLDDSVYKVLPLPSEILIRDDKVLLEQLYSDIRYQKGQILVNIDTEKQYERQVKQLIHFLQREYSFD